MKKHDNANFYTSEHVELINQLEKVLEKVAHPLIHDMFFNALPQKGQFLWNSLYLEGYLVEEDEYLDSRLNKQNITMSYIIIQQ